MVTEGNLTSSFKDLAQSAVGLDLETVAPLLEAECSDRGSPEEDGGRCADWVYTDISKLRFLVQSYICRKICYEE